MKKTSLLRWYLILVGILALFALLAWRLYQLTIVQGDDFLALSESRRTKEIQIPAPRGNIYDRNGVLLAGSRSSFAVQGYKDDLLRLPREERNDVIARLLRYIEHDGAEYYEELPITLDAVVYASDADYERETQTPMEKMQQLLRDNDLVDDWLSQVYQGKNDAKFQVSPAARALSAMSLKGSRLPIAVDVNERFRLSWEEGEAYQGLLDEEQITSETTPLEYLAKRVSENTNIFFSTLNHPAARALAYNVLSRNGKQEDLRLADVVYTYQEQFRLRKAVLHQSFDDITLHSSAKEDFVAMVRQEALPQFLTSIRVIEEDNRFLIPAEAILNQLSNLGIASNLKYTISPDATNVEIEYEKEEDTDETPVDRLIRLAQAHDLLDDIIANDDYKSLAEQSLFDTGIYPGISISTWQYGVEKSQSDFLKKYKLETETPQEARPIVEEAYELDPAWDPVLKQGIMMITEKVIRPGNYAFWPTNVTYELSEDTVAKIEENIPASSGFMVSQQSIRYYPFGESASHVLGYIGKIATEAEIKNYVTEQGYLPNEFIGKTGVEESFEETLHGVSGKETVLVDSRGNRTETLDRQEPKAGNNVYLTIDIRLQQQAETSVRNAILATKHGRNYVSQWGTSPTEYSPTANSGASISVDPNNGELLEMTSYPMFDPNLFVTGISGSDWNLYQADAEVNREAPKPLFNLITQSSIQPGSMFKTVVSLSALEKGFDPRTLITDLGFVRIGNRQFNNLLYTLTGGTDGTISLYDAIGKSNNYYFYILGLGRVPTSGRDIGVQVTVDDIEKTAKELGMDQASGLEIQVPQEAPNHIVSRESKLGLSKTLLNNFLEANLEKYVKDGTRKTNRQVEEDIKTILTWSEQGESTVRSQLIADLDALGYKPEEPLKGSYTGLADILKYTYFNQSDWTTADTMNAVIGQGQNAYTPATISTLVSTIANRGTDFDLTLIREIRSADNRTVLYQQTPHSRKVDIPEKYFDDVIEGMRRSAIHNAEGFDGLPFEIGSKTGTAQRGGIDPRTKVEYASYAWDMAFAPLNNPRIATVTFMPAGQLSSNVVPISRDIIASYMEVPAHQDVPSNLYEGLKTYYPEEAKFFQEEEEKNDDTSAEGVDASSENAESTENSSETSENTSD